MSAERQKAEKERRKKMVEIGNCNRCFIRPARNGRRRCQKCHERQVTYKAETFGESNGVGFGEIGQAIGLSRQRVIQIYQFALFKMETAFEVYGVDISGMRLESFLKVALARESDWRMAHWSEYLATAIETGRAKATAKDQEEAA